MDWNRYLRIWNEIILVDKEMDLPYIHIIGRGPHNLDIGYYALKPKSGEKEKPRKSDNCLECEITYVIPFIRGNFNTKGVLHAVNIKKASFIISTANDEELEAHYLDHLKEELSLPPNGSYFFEILVTHSSVFHQMLIPPIFPKVDKKERSKFSEEKER